jgi:hypothetical protein
VRDWFWPSGLLRMFLFQQHYETSWKQMEKMILDHMRVFGGRDLLQWQMAVVTP